MIEDLQQVTSDYALLVVPLLVENNLDSLCDRVLVVDVEPETQISRTVKRDNVSEEQAHAILASQASRQQRLDIADDVVKTIQMTQIFCFKSQICTKVPSHV